MAGTGEALNPFTEADRPRFDALRSKLGEIMAFIERLRKCGIACEENAQTCAEIAEFCEVVEAEFLPPRE